MKIRVLCGSYVPSSPFIDGGCAFDWIESLDEPRDVICPGCGDVCESPWVECALHHLQTRVVFIIGCPHRGFSFSRREREPYFSPIEMAGEASES